MVLVLHSNLKHKLVEKEREREMRKKKGKMRMCVVEHQMFSYLPNSADGWYQVIDNEIFKNVLGVCFEDVWRVYMLGIIVRPVFFCSKILVMSKKMKNFKTGMSKTTETLCFTSKKKKKI